MPFLGSREIPTVWQDRAWLVTLTEPERFLRELGPYVSHLVRGKTGWITPLPSDGPAGLPAGESTTQDPRLNNVIGKRGDDTSLHTELSKIKAIDYGPNLECIPVVSLPIGIRSCLFLQRGVIADATAHRLVPTPFPEGELLDSPGFAASRLPWVRN